MCTLDKRGGIFFLTLTGDDEHRLNPSLIAAIRSSLRRVSTTPCSALVTTATGKFFSNGFDLAWASKADGNETAGGRLHLMVELFRGVVQDLIEMNVVTIAAVTGHAAAAGMMLALSHDYVFMRGDRGVLYMSELDIGMTFPDYFTAMFRSKIGSPAVRRNIMLKAAKIKAAEAAAVGIIDSAHENGEKALEAAVSMAEQLGKRKWSGDVYREIRKDMYPELCAVLGLKAKSVVVAKL